jgi:hypothetical protein
MAPLFWFMWWSGLVAASARKHAHGKPELRVIEGGRR